MFKQQLHEQVNPITCKNGYSNTRGNDKCPEKNLFAVMIFNLFGYLPLLFLHKCDLGFHRFRINNTPSWMAYFIDALFYTLKIASVIKKVLDDHYVFSNSIYSH